MNEGISISEAAERANLTVHTLRYYEKERLLPSIWRSGSGHRRYGDADVSWAIFITRLRSTGMPIRQIRRYVDLFRQGPSTEAERLALLEEHREEVRDRMEEIAQNLALIELKIQAYKNNTAITPALPESNR